MNTEMTGSTLRLLGQIVAVEVEVEAGKKITPVEVEVEEAEIDTAAVEGLEG